MGEFLNACVKGRLNRSFIGNTDKLRPLAEGASFLVYQSKLRFLEECNGYTTSIRVFKVLRGTPPGKSPSQNASNQAYQATQLQAMIREVLVLTHKPLKEHENPYIDVEYAEGGNLKDFARSHRALSPDQTRELALDVTSGMEALYACGIARGDIKLENILVFKHAQRGNCAKISDFSHSSINSSPNEYFGTERCHPPELSATETRGLVLTFNELLICDMWGFGVVVFELLTAKKFDLLENNAIYSVNTVLADAKLNTRLRKMEVEQADLWTDVLSILLQKEASKRGTMKAIRQRLDTEKSLLLEPMNSTLDHSFLSIPDLQSNYIFADDKYRFFKMLLHLSTYGPTESASRFYFQLAQAHTIGLGVTVDTATAIYGYIFGLGGTVDRNSDNGPDIQLMSVVRRLMGMSMGKVDGTISTDIAEIEETLAPGSDQNYYSRRIVEYRALSARKMNAMQLSLILEVPTMGRILSLSKIFQENIPHLMDHHVITPLEAVHNITLPDKIPLLHYVCLIGEVEYIKMLLSSNDSESVLAARDEIGLAPLHYACMGGHLNLVKYLVLEKSVERFPNSHDGTTPLHWLSFFSEDKVAEIAQILADPKSMNAISNGHRIPLHFLWLRGTPLHWAVSCRNLNVVKTLLLMGADIDLEHQGSTALSLAVELHAYEIIDFLLESGAKDHITHKPTGTIIHHIAGNAPIVKRKLLHGRQEKQALMKTIRVLETFGCQINMRDEFGNTPLHKAVASAFERGDLYVSRALLLCGADRKIQNRDGDTALHIAVLLSMIDSPNDLELVNLLLNDDIASMSDSPMNLTLVDRNGRNPLLLSASTSIGGKFVRLFSSYYATNKEMLQQVLLARDKDSKTFMDLAMNKGIERFQWIRDEVNRLRQIGLGVSIENDCS